VRGSRLTLATDELGHRGEQDKIGVYEYAYSMRAHGFQPVSYNMSTHSKLGINERRGMRAYPTTTGGQENDDHSLPRDGLGGGDA
jgi:hypothetical protein